jgi:hypothetical protein
MGTPARYGFGIGTGRAGRRSQAEDLLVAELCRHLPGLAPAIRAIVDHFYSEGAETGMCCLPEAGPS